MFRRTSAFHWLITCALAALVIAAPVTPALAQSATGSIEGSIVDQTGAAMPGVTVTIIQTATPSLLNLTTLSERSERPP